MDVIERVITFWFGERDSAELGKPRRELWFVKTAKTDAEIARRFGADMEAAADGRLNHLAETVEGALALVILLDQFPRNVFRDTPRAFATDAKARVIAREALDKDFDRELLMVQRCFLYLPFEHSEDLADQERSVELFGALDGYDVLEYAIRHRDIVARFGHFPHRNAILGRESTPEEIEFLKEPGSSF